MSTHRITDLMTVAGPVLLGPVLLGSVLLGSVLLGSVLEARGEPMTRQSAIAVALRNNPEVKAARAEWDAARARAKAAWAPSDPEFEIEFEELKRLSEPGEFAERSIGISQTIEFPLKWWLNRKAADREAKAVRASVYNLTRLDVVTRVAASFDRVLSRQQVLALETEHEILLVNFARKTRLRHEAGAVPQLEVLRAEVESGRAASRVVAAGNELALARGQLSVLLAHDGAGELELNGADPARGPELTLEEAQARGLQRRPDLQGARRLLESHRALLGARRAGLFPDLSVGVFRQTLRDAGASESLWRLGLAMEIPLWGALRQRGDLAEAKAKLAGAEAEAERLRREVKLEVETAYRNLKTAQDQVALFDERILREAKAAQRAAGRSYDEGKASYLEVLSAQRTLLETRVEYADIQFAYREASAALDRAMGGDLPE
jgi:cobalt-zinc-cadmium efflux system outer membrane protein